MIDIQFNFPYWYDNLPSMRGKPVYYNDKKIGKITSVTIGYRGIPLVSAKIYKKYFNLIKEII